MQMDLSEHHPRNTTPSGGAWYKINPNRNEDQTHQDYFCRVKNDEINFSTNGQFIYLDTIYSI